MVYLARFSDRDLSPVIIDEPDIEGDELGAAILRAADRVEKETGERPLTMQPVPSGLLFTEVKFRTSDLESADDEPNPANYSAAGVVLEPFDLFAEWLEYVDAQDLPAVLALAPTEPPAEEGTHG